MDPSLTQGHQQPMYNPYNMPVLPAGWIEYRTPTGQPYWYNTNTRQSSWVYPLQSSIPPTSVAIPPKKKKQIKKKIPNTHWLFVLTHDGYEFYYDRGTKTSVWDMPEELKEPMEELKKMEQEEKENKKRAALEEQEAELKAKRVKLEQEVVEKSNTENTKQEHTTEEQLDATEMTEEDIMWQLQQMESEPEEEMLEKDQAEPVTEDHQQTKKEEEDDQPLIDTKPNQDQLPEEERIAKFNELLQERDISPFAVYTTEYPKLMTDPRFTMVAHNKQKALFNKYCNALGEKLKNEKKNKMKPEDAFRDLLESNVAKKMYWDDFRRKYKQDPRFLAVTTTKEREALFKDHVKHHLGKKRASPTDEYMDLLSNTKEIRVGIRWRDAKRILEKDDRYYAIESKTEREDLFRDYLEQL